MASRATAVLRWTSSMSSSLVSVPLLRAPPQVVLHCILLTTEAGAGDNWRGRELDCVPRGGQLRLGVTRHDKWGRVFSGDQESVRTRRSRPDSTFQWSCKSSMFQRVFRVVCSVLVAAIARRTRDL